jgi:hypothetical protein
LIALCEAVDRQEALPTDDPNGDEIECEHIQCLIDGLSSRLTGEQKQVAANYVLIVQLVKKQG